MTMKEHIKEVLTVIAWVCSCATTIAAAVLLIAKPVKKRAKAVEAEDEGLRCMLRSDMLRIYYHGKESKKIRQFEFENFILEYKAYKAMGGNSFIDHIMEEVEEWEVVSS